MEFTNTYRNRGWVQDGPAEAAAFKAHTGTGPGSRLGYNTCQHMQRLGLEGHTIYPVGA